MKYSGFLSTSLLALLLSTSLTMASATDTNDTDDGAPAPVTTTPAPVDVPTTTTPADDNDAADNDDGAAASSSTLSAEDQKYDKDGDGKLGLGEKLTKFVDGLGDGDGDADLDDVKAFFSNLLNRIPGAGIFDQNEDGKIEFNEIRASTEKALESFQGISNRLQEITDQINASGILEKLPESLRDPLTSLISAVNGAAEKVAGGTNIGDTLEEEVDKPLEGVKKNIKDLSKVETNEAEKKAFKKGLFSYLEMVKRWDRTGNNAKKVNKIEERLVKA